MANHSGPQRPYFGFLCARMGLTGLQLLALANGLIPNWTPGAVTVHSFPLGKKRVFVPPSFLLTPTARVEQLSR